ncbi:COG1361 family protein [Halorussus salinisoli]|uniref:hypothetical protein n=1 Tax=Halorussus salinisoli TaxID=2558242 RepID=UPI0010C18CD9|nr:hypothetical protein [Halorussus salinisoli]
MNRRHFITATTLSLSALAGCTGGGNDSSQSSQTTAETETEQEGSTETTSTRERTTEEGEAEFELVSSDVPEKVELGEEFAISAEIKNVGSAPGEFDSAISAKTASSDWQQAGDAETEEIEPGETATWTSETVTFEYLMRVTYRIEKLEQEFTIQAVSRKLSLGESFTTPEGVVVSVQRFDLKSYYEYEGYDGSTEQKRAGDGKRWAFVYLKAENTAGQSNFIPLETDVNLIARNSQYDQKYVNKEENRYEGGEVEAGIVRKGWLAYEIPNDLSKTDLTVAWSDRDGTGEWSVRWSA